MRRNEDVPARPGWRELVMREGLAYVDTVTPDDKVVSYWREGVCYMLGQAELDVLLKACERLFAMLVEAGDYIIARDLFHKLGIPDWAVPAIRELWKDPGDPADSCSRRTSRARSRKGSAQARYASPSTGARGPMSPSSSAMSR
jgi:glutathionylspermidine synthase